MLEILYIRQEFDFENQENIIKQIVKNCPKLRNLHMEGKGLNISEQFLIGLFKEFNVATTIYPGYWFLETNLERQTYRYVDKNDHQYIVIKNRQELFEEYMKKHDLQLYNKYKKLEPRLSRLSDLSFYFA